MSTANIFMRLMVALAIGLFAVTMQAQEMSREEGVSSGAAASGGAAGATVSAADRRLMADLARANQAEIALSRLALERSQNPEVLAFARKMIDDHMQAATELTELAQDKGVTLPTEPDAKHRAMARQLSRRSGAQFDRQFMAQAGLHDHQSTHALLERMRTQAADPDLKALAEKNLPVIEQHMEAAKEQVPSAGQ